MNKRKYCMVQTLWQITYGDILDNESDALICSANPQLNLSGGVGGQLLKKYGKSMQKELREYLKKRELYYLREGEIACIFPEKSPYKIIIHAIAINAFYESSAQIVTTTILKALDALQEYGQAQTVTIAALATGYGNLTIKEFSSALESIYMKNYFPIEKITICMKKEEDALVIQKYFQ